MREAVVKLEIAFQLVGVFLLQLVEEPVVFLFAGAQQNHLNVALKQLRRGLRNKIKPLLIRQPRDNPDQRRSLANRQAGVIEQLHTVHPLARQIRFVIPKRNESVT